MSNIKDKKVTNVPNLRFKRFKSEWSKKRCSSFLDFYSTNSLSWENLNYQNGEVKNIHYGIIHNGLSTNAKVESSDIPYINKDIELKTCNICEDGDIIFADASEDTSDIAKAVELISVNNEKVVCGLHTIHARDNDKVTSLGFKGYLFASTSFKNQIRKIAQGTKVYAVSSKNFREIFLHIPCKEEQIEIVKLLTLIDERIETQNKIIEELKRLKNGIRNLLLCENSKLNKRIMLNNYASLKNGYAFKSGSYTNNGTYKIATITNVTGERYSDMTSCNYIREHPIDIQEHQTLRSCDILISLTGNVGRVSYVGEENVLLNQRVGVLHIYNEELREYIFQSLSSKIFLDSMVAAGQGAAQLNISKNDIETYVLSINDDKEYCIMIGNFLHLYDRKIEYGNTLLKLLIKQKRYLVHNMFI